MPAAARPNCQPTTVPSRVLARILFALLAAALCALHSASFTTAQNAAFAGDDDPHCRCATSDACYHYLNAPVPAPDPTCACPKCTKTSRHAGDKVPDGWSPDCFTSRGMDCFLKRHAASWRLTCSECVTDLTCCKSASPPFCPQCGKDGKSPWRKDAARTIEAQLAIERAHFDRARVVVIVGPHAYVVTDAAQVRVAGESGQRVVSTHEYAHILAMRAESAYREFADDVGSPAVSRPVGVFVPQSESDATGIKKTYFRHPGAPMIYAGFGSESESAISDGFCVNGFCVSMDRMGKDDGAVHQAVRHYLANIFFTNWVITNGESRTNPAWAFEGLAQWFGTRPGGALADHHVLCSGEKGGPEGPNKNWAAKLGQMVRSNGLRPADQVMDLADLDNLTFDDHVQLWGWFDVAMTDIRVKWVKMLNALRRQVPARDAFKQELGWTPEEFQKRFSDRVQGLRASIDDGPAVSNGAATPPAIDFSADPKDLASRMRSQGAPADAAAAKRLLDAMGGRSDLVRETAFAQFIRAKSADVRALAHSYGLVAASATERAYAARACRVLSLVEARDTLRKTILDSSWLVRAESALALAAIRDFDAQAKMREMVASDPSPKAQIGALDALTLLGKDANVIAIPVICGALQSERWQVKIAACQALCVLGDMSAVSPLVAQMQLEGGRVAEEIRKALVAITYDDLGPKPESWRIWWEKEEARAKDRGGFTKPSTTVDPRYAPETPGVFGIENWSSRIGFVLDTSASTSRRFTPHPDMSTRLFGDVRTSTIQKVMEAEIARSLRALDSRAQFAVWTFAEATLRWQGGKLSRASKATVESAIGYLESQSPTGETDFHTALRAVLQLEDEDGYSSQFKDTPDTITLITDGHATTGEITEPTAIALWYTGLNRYARIRTHTIAIGKLDVDETLLERLAKENGGRFVQVVEYQPK